MLTLDDSEYPPVAFLAGFPSGIQLSQLLDPRSVREAKAAPTPRLEGSHGLGDG
jgi:hypothetical protein